MTNKKPKESTKDENGNAEVEAETTITPTTVKQHLAKSNLNLEEEIKQTVTEQLSYAYDLDAATQTNDNKPWELFFEDRKGVVPMALYRQKFHESSSSPDSSSSKPNIICDPIRAVATVPGVTAHELCAYFFSPDHRSTWESHILFVKVLETVNSNTLVLHQAYESPVWTVSEREALFWSAFRQADQRQVKSIEGVLKELKDDDPFLSSSSSKLHDVWMVVNKSTSRDEEISSVSGKRIRLDIVVSLIAETYIVADKDKDKNKSSSGKKISRDQLRTRFHYNAQSNPGGWIPLPIIRTVYKKEFPKMMRRFTETTAAYYRHKEVSFGGDGGDGGGDN
ncbi:PREDICTED: collagen type IV alpha-3-binding protein-like [Rhagoletis zephyria]|uniref:collagen type IV alpha-3-binding protein-like n=1 Tax=Rhagoletis zephyria TaxID=28612 RepID=UPI000811626F|nr:PREDICTED: collagen type IV alpha-3-binding protein-like [Rhagoletis zephyria]